MSVKKNKKRGTYEVRWREGTKQPSRSFARKKDAEAFEAQLLTDRRRGTYIDTETARITFGECATAWLAGKAGKQSTLNRDIGILRKHLLPTLGSRRLVQIKRADIQRMVGSWVDAGLMPRTITRHLAVLSAILNFAVEEEWLVKSPVLKVNRPKSEEPHRMALTEREAGVLLDEIGPKYEPFVYVALSTGLRWGELAALNISDLDWQQRRLTVQDSKTAAGKRTISLSHSDMARIAAHMQATGRTAAHGDEPLFLSPKGHRINYRNFTVRVLKPAAVRAGLEGLNFHDTRRTNATLMVKAGVDLKVIQERLGHADIRTTLNLYAKGTREGHDKAALAIEALLSTSTDGVLPHVAEA